MLKEGLLSWRLRSGAGSAMCQYYFRIAQIGRPRMKKEIQLSIMLPHHRKMMTNEMSSSVLSHFTHGHTIDMTSTDEIQSAGKLSTYSRIGKLRRRHLNITRLMMVTVKSLSSLQAWKGALSL